MLTFEPWKDDTTLIRFEHILAKDEADQQSQEITFNFHDVFRSFDISWIRETTLSANQWLEDLKRLQFVAEESDTNEDSANEVPEQKQAQPNVEINESDSNEPKPDFKRATKNDDNKFIITLKPMEIRTFVVELEPPP